MALPPGPLLADSRYPIEYARRRHLWDAAAGRKRNGVNGKAREIKIVDDSETEVGCDGGGGGLGHPLVYLPFDGRAWVDCYYCGQRFAKSGYESPDSQSQA